MKRNASAPKLLEMCGSEDLDPLDKSSVYKTAIFPSSNYKFSTIGGTRWLSKPKLINRSVVGSLEHKKPTPQPHPDSERPRINHSCGKLIVVDKTPPLPPRHLSKPPPVHRHASKEEKVCVMKIN